MTLIVGRYATAALLAMILVAGVAGQKGKPAKEPVVQGKTIREWGRVLKSKELLARVRAINALIQAGPEARDAAASLIGVFSDRDATFLHPLAAVALSRMGADAVPELRKALGSKTVSVRAGAALTLGLIGATARAAASSLGEALKDEDGAVRQAAAQALGRLERAARPAVPALMKALDDSDASVRVEAAAALWRITGEPSGLGTLSRALAEVNFSLVQRALAVLGDMGDKAKPATTAVRGLLASKDIGVRIAAAETLYRVTNDIGSALPVVLAALASKDRADHRAAVSALGTLGAESQLVVLLTSKEAELRREAASALVGRGVISAEARNALEGRLQDRDASVAWWCALAVAASDGDVRRQEGDVLRAFRRVLFRLGDREPPAGAVVDVQVPSRAVSALVTVLKARPTRFQVEAARALGQLGLDARPALPDLLDALRSDDKLVQRTAADTLGTLGVEAMASLIRLLGNEDARLREGAARALGRMGLAARSAVPALNRLVKDAEAPVRSQVALALWNIEQNAETPIAILNLILKDVDNKDRWAAVEGIGMVGLEARPLIKGILEVLYNAVKDRDVRVRMQAAKWLWRRVRDGKVIVPLVRDGVTERDLLAKLTAIEVLGELSADNRVVPLLIPALEDREVTVRLAAEEALARGGAASVPQLLEALESKSAKVRQGVAWALALIGPDAKVTRPRLSRLLKDDDPQVRAAVAAALAAMGG